MRNSEHRASTCLRPPASNRLVLVLVTCSVLLAATARGDVAVLPAQGAPTIAAKVDLRVSQGITKNNYREVLTPLQVQSRLRSGEAVSTATARLSEAKEAVVYMKRAPAIGAARAALDALGPFGGFHSPQLVARAHGMLALALLLRPADEAGALREFQSALAADSHYRPSADHSSSQVRDHFARAQRSYQPRSKLPVGLAKQLAVSHLISITIDTTAETAQVRVVLRNDRGRVTRPLQETAIPVAKLPARALALVTQALNKVVKPAVTRRDLKRKAEPARGRRLWTWIVAGGSVAALATGIGLGFAAQSDHDDWQRLKQEGKDYDSWVSLRDAGEAKALSANILLGVAGALAVTATVLFFVEPSGHERRTSVSLTLTPTTAGVRGSF